MHEWNADDGIRRVGDVVYTENDIAVFNICVHNLTAHIKEKYLRKYFSKFGKITSVTVIRKESCYAFVNFKKAKSAAKVLNANYHFVKGRRVTVKAADSWWQPPEAFKIEHNEEISPNSILKLNDDCLFKIFSYLSLQEQINMSEICDRFKTIFRMIFKIKKSLDIDYWSQSVLSLAEIRYVLVTVGDLIESLSYFGEYLPNYRTRTIKLLPRLCPNLKILKLNTIFLSNPTIFRDIVKKLKKIQQLELVNCDIGDKECSYICELKNLKELNLCYNMRLTGKYLDKLIKLKKLKINNCDFLKPQHFAKICTTLHGLKELDIKLCRCLNQNSINLIASELLNLENLTISMTNKKQKIINLNKIAELKKLKNLTIFGITWNDNLFVNLSMNNEHVLENLKMFNSRLQKNKLKLITSIKSIKNLCIMNNDKIDDEFLFGCANMQSLIYLDVSGCQSFTRNGIKFILKISESIEVLDISYCRQFSHSFIYNIINLIKLRKRCKPFLLNVGKTNINRNILDESIYYNEVKGLLTLTFDHNVTQSVFVDDYNFSNDSDDE